MSSNYDVRTAPFFLNQANTENNPSSTSRAPCQSPQDKSEASNTSSTSSYPTKQCVPSPSYGALLNPQNAPSSPKSHRAKDLSKSVKNVFGLKWPSEKSVENDVYSGNR